MNPSVPKNLLLTLVFALGTVAPAAAASPQKAKFFDSAKMYFVRIQNWSPAHTTPVSLVRETETPGATLELFLTDPKSDRHCPDDIATADRRLLAADKFSVRVSGNFTNGTPKASLKVKLAKTSTLFGMNTLNLKSMWNDVSQMREALVWKLMADAQVPAPRHTYAKLCINGRYWGLFSVIEEIDKSFLEERFGAGAGGNLYKANWSEADLGPATLEHRKSRDGSDDGRAYIRAPKFGDRTYELKTNDKGSDPRELQSYDDLAIFVRTIHQTDPGSAAFRQRLERVFDVKAFLRWAAVNVLVGAWDNYWITPSNYLLFNSGAPGGRRTLMSEPYFHWIPWDYDLSFGIAFGGPTKLQNVDVLNWGGERNPLVDRVLANPDFRAYYLAQIARLLKTSFNPQAVERDVARLFAHIEKAVYLESDTAKGQPHTGRQFTNEQVYWNGREHHALVQGGAFLMGIRHWTVMRHASATQNLRRVRP